MAKNLSGHPIAEADKPAARRRGCHMIDTGKHALISRAGLALAAACSFVSPALGPALAQEPCPCNFKERPWHAVGTKALCTAWMMPGRTSCTIEFGGISTDMKLVAEVLGLDQAKYRAEVYDVITRYLQYLRDEKTKELVDPGFLSRALLIGMRGAYLRGPLSEAQRSQIKNLDAVMV